jgi:hypothetical protein
LPCLIAGGRIRERSAMAIRFAAFRADRVDFAVPVAIALAVVAAGIGAVISTKGARIGRAGSSVHAAAGRPDRVATSAGAGATALATDAVHTEA